MCRQKLIVFDAVIRARAVDGDRVQFLGLYGRDMIHTAKTEFGLSLSHIIIVHISYRI